ncbi:hypothetical protein SAMN04487857_107207 [Pseudomonas sp. ok272]|uniref:hypothetical protein n=1 Tax=unclassified Pseudomonas TaxID=196821 RepID=UPI0008BF8D5C|nr:MULTISPECIES: hypothetical protein [unclassified Pseudomonas]SEM95679.1 hypothetical protein SAMN04487857_107207 [Pseudomonas sp. ok272]SFM92720.1 hypothetical protein SAMN04487858_10910 [Pseudomonas sp. ok602]
MTGLDMIATGALVLLGLILMLLSLQFMRLRDVWKLMLNCRTTMRWARIQEMENRELRSALRAHQAQVEQLKGSLSALQASVSA